jgi:carboxyl-terminal processing protease
MAVILKGLNFITEIMSRKPLLFIVVVLLLSPSLVLAQSPEVKFLIDTSISIMRQNAVNASQVNWDVLKEEALKKAADITNPYQLGNVMRYLYKSINDFHGAFFYRDSTFRWSQKEFVVSDSIMNEWKKRSGIKTKLLNGNIGYLRIPSMPVADNKEFNSKAQDLNDSLCSLLTKNIKGIILDLRLNGGGAMHPMILGVEQLLGHGHVGSFHVKKEEGWFINEDGFFVDTTLFGLIVPASKINAQNMPVVMLISPATGSAAECLIISFKGRKNTVLLGSSTAGYVTVNTGFPISNMAFMNLAVGYSADRNGKLYTTAIAPDIPFTGTDKFNDIENDEKVKAAMQWLILHFQ